MNLDEMIDNEYSKFVEENEQKADEIKQKEMAEKLAATNKFKTQLSEYLPPDFQNELNFNFENCHTQYGYPMAVFDYMGICFKCIQWNKEHVKLICDKRHIESLVRYEDLLKTLLINFGEIKSKLCEFEVSVVINYKLKAYNRSTALYLATEALSKAGYEVDCDKTYEV